MATLTLANVSQTFAPTTTVKAFPQKGFPVVMPQSGVPAGTQAGIDTAVAAGGSLTILNLAEQTYYVLYAATPDRYMVAYIEASGEITVIATQATGDFAIMTAGKTLRIKEGSNAKMGTATLSGGTVTVSNTSVTAESVIFLQRYGVATNAGALNVTAQTAATSFKVDSNNVSDAGTFHYLILEPA